MEHGDPYAQHVETSCDSNFKELAGSSNSPSSSGSSNPNNEEQPNAFPLLDMPKEDLLKIMQKVIPPHAEITNKAAETIQQCVSKFISTITSEANKQGKSEKRKVVAVKDLLSAMEGLGLNNYVEPLLVYHDRYLENEANLSMGGNRVANNVMALPPQQQQLQQSRGNSTPATPTFNPINASSSGSGYMENFDQLAFLDP